MQLHYIIENEIIPKKILAIALVRFFREMNAEMYTLLSTAGGFANELQMDHSQPEMELMVNYSTENNEFPEAELRKLMMSLAEKHRLSAFKPKMTIDSEHASDFWVSVHFQKRLGLDEKALDAAREEMEKAGMLKDWFEPGDPGCFLTINH